MQSTTPKTSLRHLSTHIQSTQLELGTVSNQSQDAKMSRRSGHSPAIGTAGGPSSPLSRSRSTSLETEDETLSQPPHSPAAPDYGPSPSASAFLKTAETLEGLANQLSILSDVEHSEGEPAAPECCCTIEASRGRCKVAEDKEKMATKLALSGGKCCCYGCVSSRLTMAEIGNALLLRYEALEKKYTFEVKRLEHQVCLQSSHFETYGSAHGQQPMPGGLFGADNGISSK